MPKLILNTIVKNESHVILKMLESAIKISDAIIILDTGSTDGTQDMILDYGKKNNIPTYVFNRDFDNFENSRNFAMEKARETVANELQWNPDDCFTWWCDADETVIVDPEFSKSQFVNDLYMINAFIGKMKYTRNTFARVSKPLDGMVLFMNL
jgi:glycosyltransferase involved in cell wall biosynthesis